MANVRLYGNRLYQVAVVHDGPGALGSVAAIVRELAKDFGVLEPCRPGELSRNSLQNWIKSS